MHKLIEYVCDELEALERKADKEGKLSMAEIQYGDTLAHLKKNLMKTEEMADDGYSMSMMSNRRSMYDDMGRGSYVRRDERGRYSREGYSRKEDFKEELRELMDSAPNEHVRQKLHNIMNEM